jgi:ADP-heptose:LPS heptosyltransferase
LLLLRRHGLAGKPVRNEFVLPDHALKQASEFMTSHGLDQEVPTLYIQPFTSSEEKNWPLERYLEVARYWQARKWQVLFGGGPDDRAALEPAREAGYPIAAGVPILVSAGLADLSTLVIGGDTGLIHLAVAMGKRVVMIMRSVFAGSTHPFQHPDWAISAANKDPVASIAANAVNEYCAHAAAEMGVLNPGPCARSIPVRVAQAELA